MSARTVTFSTFQICFLQELALLKQLLDPALASSVDQTSADDKCSKVSKKFKQRKFFVGFYDVPL